LGVDAFFSILLTRLSEQLAAVDDGGLRGTVAADCDPRVLVQRTVVVRAPLGCRMKSPGLRGTVSFGLNTSPSSVCHVPLSTMMYRSSG
jgi:hypothetical protein